MSRFTLPNKKEESKELVPKVDVAALNAFAAGARDKALELEQAERPWAKFKPTDPAKYNVSVRLNDHHLEMLRYLAAVQDTTQQRILRKHLVPIIERLAEEAFAKGGFE